MDDPTLVVRSPTYTYYQRYSLQNTVHNAHSGEQIKYNSDVCTVNCAPCTLYHMDLYRLEDYETWVSIGGEEIAEDPTTIMLIEWPEILGERVLYTQKISIEVMETGERKVVVEKII